MPRRPNAYSQLIQEGQSQPQTEEPKPEENGNTVIPRHRNNVTNRNTVKITIYPSQAQLGKLYDLMEAYRKKTGMKINQQDLIRRLIDVADIDTILP